MPTGSYNLGPTPGAGFFQSQFARSRIPSDTISLKGQTAIITGGNVGLGLGCADWLLKLGLSRLILGVRTQSKGEAAATELRAKHPQADIQVWTIDMLSYDSIIKFSERCKTLDRLDTAILNAGVFQDGFAIGPEGHEVVLQVNYLSTVLLSHLLLPTLKNKSPAGQPGRLTVVNSGTCYVAKLTHRNADPWLAAWNDENGWDMMQQYSSTKAIGHLWALKLAEKVSPQDVIFNLVDPGLSKGTGLHTHMGAIHRMVFGVVKMLFGRTLEQSVSTYVDAAVVKGPESHGSYIMDWKISPYVECAYGDEGRVLADKLWRETMKELKFAGAEQFVNGLSQ